MTDIAIDSDHIDSDHEELAAKAPPGRRKGLLIGFAAVVILAGLGWGAWSIFFSADTESTENAYTAADVAVVTPMVPGAVQSIAVEDTQSVKRGQVLLTLDDVDAKLAVASAEAGLAQVRRGVQQIEANDAALAGQLGAREGDITSTTADLDKAMADFDKAKLDLQRRRSLGEPGAVSKQEISNAETALRQAAASVAQARARIAGAQAARMAAAGNREANAVLVRGTTVDTNPSVLAAQAKLDQARVNLERTVIRAPIDGVVDQRTVEIGQQLTAGQRLMVVVPIDHVYVAANFKEDQLRGVAQGQHVRLTADLYGSSVVYDGRVVGFAGGTGSAFSSIPAQNATGNWIKVVQRLPVRIALDPAQLREHPLRVGLSMKATIELASPTTTVTAR